MSHWKKCMLRIVDPMLDEWRKAFDDWWRSKSKTSSLGEAYHASSAEAYKAGYDALVRQATEESLDGERSLEEEESLLSECKRNRNPKCRGCEANRILRGWYEP